ncbi:50S ribosomal protein L18 [bacterium]|nr:50S ribosomal protein L18 [bacterium]
MPKVIRNSTNPRTATRLKRKVRIRKKIMRHQGQVARLVVYRSNKFLYAQLIDDGKAHTLAQASTQEDTFKDQKSRHNIAAAKTLGGLIAKRALDKKVERVLFDRNGFDYHGRIKAIADGAREAGLQF